VDPGLRLAPTPKLAPPAPADGPGVLVFDAESAEWNGDLGAFLRAKAVAPARRLHVKARGSGAKRCSPVRLPDGMTLELEVEPPGAPEVPWLSLAPEPEATDRALIELHGGSLVLSGLSIQAEDECRLESLIHVDDGFLVLVRCELTGPQGAKPPTTRLITYRAATTRPRPVESELFTIPWDRPACALSDCILITGGAGIEAEVGLGFVGLSKCIVAARGDAIRLAPAKVARDRFMADLRIERSTIASGAAVVRMKAWPGAEPGPDRPWLISSSDTAYLDLHTRESVLLRADVEAFAQGQVFCQQANDAVEVFAFAEAGEGPPPNRVRDVVTQWINFWGSNHMRGVTGPRPGSSSATVRFLERPRGGRIEPDDLRLDRNHSPGRSSLSIGAPMELLIARRRPPQGRGG
jgi:serine/threonine-protein kinase